MGMKTKLLPDSVVDATMAVIRAVLGLVTRHEDLSSLSDGLGRAKNRVSRFLTGDRDLAQKEVVHLAQSRGIAPWVFFDLVRLELAEPTPGEIVRQLCRNPYSKEPADPFLEQHGQRLGALTSKLRFGSQGKLVDLAAAVEEVEELRNVSVPLAKTKLESALAAAILEAEGSSDLAEEDFEGLAIACGLWATLARLRRRYDDAAEMYPLAFGLVENRRPCKAVPLLRQRASYLLAACGFIAYASEFLSRAGSELLALGDEEAYAKTQVDRATFLCELTRRDEAAILLKAALEKLSRSSWRYRVCAWAHLAIIFEVEGKIAESRQRLDQALEEYGSRQDSYKGHLCWTAARLADRQGAKPEAEALFVESVDLLFQFAQPLNAEIVLVDLAAFFVREQRYQAAQDLGRRVLAALGTGRYDAKTAEIAAAIPRHLAFETPNSSSIAKLRAILEAAGDAYRSPAVHDN